MRPGTLGFVGARLREGREARGLSASALAEILEVSRQAVSQYENGQKVPRPEVMQKIQETLNLPSDFFWRPVTEPKSRKFFWRSNSAATKTERIRAAHKFEWLETIVEYLETYIKFPDVNFPDFGHLFSDGRMPRHPSALSFDLIESLATKTREFWGLGNEGSISNIVWLLENNGAIVTRSELHAETLDAFSAWSDEGRPFVFLASDKESAARSRFDAAHELAHIVLHRNVDRTCLTRAAEFRLIEDQAHRFAGAFLLPGAAFANDFSVASLDAFHALKLKWHVAIAMMIHRAADLGLVTEDQARRLWINRTRRNWRIREPLDDTLPVETPRLLLRSFSALLSESVQSKFEILSRLALPSKDIEGLACLPEGFLEQRSAPISLRDFTSGRKPTTEPDGPQSPGEVVEFRKP
jgi:Zn-dependent peptidase ImmA (M78 family)/transcriptional regulator with XRE-family HTH domain